MHRKIIHPRWFSRDFWTINIGWSKTLDKEPWSWGCVSFFGRIFWFPKCGLKPLLLIGLLSFTQNIQRISRVYQIWIIFLRSKEKNILNHHVDWVDDISNNKYLCLFSSSTFPTHQSTSADFFPHHIKRIRKIWPDGGRLFFGGSSWKSAAG